MRKEKPLRYEGKRKVKSSLRTRSESFLGFLKITKSRGLIQALIESVLRGRPVISGVARHMTQKLTKNVLHLAKAFSSFTFTFAHLVQHA